MQTIKSGEDISYIFNNGLRVGNRYITILYTSKSDSKEKNPTCSQHDLDGRVAFIAGKKHGNAVWRNSAKRRMRSIVRDLNISWPDNDVIFIAKPPLLRESYSKVLKVCEKTVFEIVGARRNSC